MYKEQKKKKEKKINLFLLQGVRTWKRLPQEAVQLLSLELLKTQLDMVQSKLLQLATALSREGGWDDPQRSQPHQATKSGRELLTEWGTHFNLCEASGFLVSSVRGPSLVMKINENWWYVTALSRKISEGLEISTTTPSFWGLASRLQSW